MLILYFIFCQDLKHQLLRAFDHIQMEKARYKFLIIIIIIITIIIIIIKTWRRRCVRVGRLPRVAKSGSREEREDRAHNFCTEHKVKGKGNATQLFSSYGVLLTKFSTNVLSVSFQETVLSSPRKLS